MILTHSFRPSLQRGNIMQQACRVHFILAYFLRPPFTLFSLPMPCNLFLKYQMRCWTKALLLGIKGGSTTQMLHPKFFESYAAQYAKDIECFLNARAQEVACGGLMAIIVPCRPNGLPRSQDTIIDTLGSCLLDTAKKVIIHLLINFF